MEGARQIMSKQVRKGREPNGREFVVIDEQGGTVLIFHSSLPSFTDGALPFVGNSCAIK